ncbi:AcrR family transcriptional regulator [Streptosporangium album]|uniref:AcrR family transcriptional regulator n=1 Tax=Streptosporangium album TaxID=47479 RepID=A0A7W7RUM3_9ACTN|nr:TetR/AcrR family transcriptional regulator [Streptosporangium album]MBB4938480.1 AcrR family transcriptional regulator [Streptosporangium album]
MPEARSSYHHGDLRDALVQAGLAMSRDRGAEAIVLREATRRVGVTARAAYRHFADRDALVHAVAQAALTQMAHAIEQRQIEQRQREARDGLAMLRGVGEGYIQFALDEPGWFDVAFFAMSDMVNPTSTDSGGDARRSPYQQFQDALTCLVGAGLLNPDRAGDAAITCWSGVHGFATLNSRGPLRQLPRERVDAQAERLVADLVDAVTRGHGPAALETLCGARSK